MTPLYSNSTKRANRGLQGVDKTKVARSGCTNTGSGSASVTLVAGSSPPSITYSIFFGSPSCAGAPDVSFVAVPADNTTCVTNAVGDARIPANSASMRVFTVPAKSYAVTGYANGGFCDDAGSGVYTAAAIIGCNPTGPILVTSSLLLPIPNTSPLAFNYTMFVGDRGS